MGTDSGRVEAFSDGVFAIAITLLVLDLVVPAHQEATEHGLAAALAAEWPSYAAYLVSFLVIGVIWINHHTMLSLVERVDRRVLFVNLLFLLTISGIPFPTRLFADYLLDPDASVAAAVYSATMFAMGLSFAALWLTVTRDAELLHRPIDAALRRTTLRRFGVGGIVYAATIGLSFLSAVVTLAVHAVIGIYYCFDQLSSAQRDPA